MTHSGQGFLVAWADGRRLRTALAAAVVMGCLLSGCSSNGDKATSARTVLTPPKASPISEQAAVTQAYTAYWPVSVQAAKLPESQARVLLAPYLTPGAVAKELAGAAEWRRKHFEPWGHVNVHVLTVKVSGGAATLTECQDATTVGIADTRTHRLIPGTTGTARVHIRAYLRRGDDGRWRLYTKEVLESKPCSVPSR